LRTIARTTTINDNTKDQVSRKPGQVQDCWFVADTGLVAALPLRLSARSKRKS
jgi:hypothetical protein